MRFSTSVIAVAALFAPSLVAADDWQCNGNWDDGGLRRLSFTFDGYCEGSYGQCFLDAIRGKGVTVHNWQAWDLGNGYWEADLSTTAGLAWQVNNAIQDVTGTWRGCWPNQ
ncbi:hypothetical protein BKA62DRAFT_711334 [Auriculariales sp. MPI-PUGE-AT-0066]|nr:hypothetical protein BKA62DRAFT_711334 [Auriculariales sp. MPI-PUGE-AT-0066]